MIVNAIVRTTENLGDHAREVEVAIHPRDGETVQGFMERIFTEESSKPWAMTFGQRFDPIRDHIELRVVQEG